MCLFMCPFCSTTQTLIFRGKNASHWLLSIANNQAFLFLGFCWIDLNKDRSTSFDMESTREQITVLHGILIHVLEGLARDT